jgi:hypothetical protein
MISLTLLPLLSLFLSSLMQEVEGKDRIQKYEMED